MKLRIASWLLLFGVMASGTAYAAAGSDKEKDEITKDPGYVDFGTVNLFGKKEPDVEVLIQDELLKMIAAVARSSDPELADMMLKLKQIRVQTFSIDAEQLLAVEKKTDEVSSRIEAQGWAPVVRVRNRRDNEQTYIYMKFKPDQKVQGLVVMNVEASDNEKQASFVNIVGEIDPEQLGKLQRKFDIQGLDSLGTSVKKSWEDKKAGSSNPKSDKK
jgi:hypothetical protein